jgi:hypothetical protein
VLIEPVAIQTPVVRGNADGFGAVALGVGLGATTAGRLALGCALAVGLGRATAGRPRWIKKNAPPSATTATTAAAATVVLDMGRVLHARHKARR